MFLFKNPFFLKLKCIFCFIYLLFTVNTFATITLPPLIGNGMVLQRDIKIPVWGWAVIGSEITIDFNGKSYKTLTDTTGKWQLHLNKQQAGGPFVMRISGNGSDIFLKDILIGDVWICSGQSNMAYNFDEERAAIFYADEINYSANDGIRQIQVVPALSRYLNRTCSTSGWLPASPKTLNKFSVVAYFFAKNMFERYHIPIGLINSSYGGTKAESWTSEKALKTFPELQAEIALYKDSAAFVKKVKESNTEKPLREKDFPTALFNAMISPLIPFGIKGAIWYQGENNAYDGTRYQKVFPNLIRDWRERWQQGNFPFVFQQLVNYGKAESNPVNSNWAKLREAQLFTSDKSANTAMSVGIDLGEADNIHPINKKEIGYRLYLAALGLTHPTKDMVVSGPVYKSMKIRRNKIVLYFEKSKSPLVAKGGGEFRHFAIAGADHKFVWAHATINNNKITVWNNGVKSPLAIRYAWADNPEGCNLYNEAGLPASPFRTDKWP